MKATDQGFVIGAFHGVEPGGDPSLCEAMGVGGVLVVEQIKIANSDERGRQAMQVSPARRHCVVEGFGGIAKIGAILVCW